MGFFTENLESRDAMRESAIRIWVEVQFAPTKVRIIKGDNEAILGMWAIWELRVAVYFNRRYIQVGQGEWKVMARTGENRFVPPSPNGARLYKIAWVFYENKIAKVNFKPYVLISRSDSE